MAKKNKAAVKKSKLKVKPGAKTSPKINTAKPTMFSDAPNVNILETANRLSDLKNIGPNLEALFHKAGIKSVTQFKKLGWKKSLVIFVKHNPKMCHSMFTYVLIGALTDRYKITEEERQEAREFTHSLNPNKKKKKA